MLILYAYRKVLLHNLPTCVAKSFIIISQCQNLMYMCNYYNSLPLLWKLCILEKHIYSIITSSIWFTIKTPPQPVYFTFNWLFFNACCALLPLENHHNPYTPYLSGEECLSICFYWWKWSEWLNITFWFYLVVFCDYWD